MAGKSDAWEADILKLLFNATNIPLVADNTVTTPLSALWVSLHTQDPLDTGNQVSFESGYTSYGRVSVNRNTGGWAVSGTGPTQVSPVAPISFPPGTGGGGVASHFGVGTVVGPASGKLFYSGTVTPNITCGNGITPQLTTASTITED